MSKFALYITASIALCFSSSLLAEPTQYVTDELTTYVYAGPDASRYRISGSVSAGEAVTGLGSQGQYSRIMDQTGKKNWILTKQLVEQPSIKTQVPDLQNRVKTLTDELNDINSTWDNKTADMQTSIAQSGAVIQDLQRENEQLKSQLDAANKKLNDVSVQVDDKQREIILQWFMYGGGVAGAGLLIGLILPHIIPKRRKNRRWMN